MGIVFTFLLPVFTKKLAARRDYFESKNAYRVHLLENILLGVSDGSCALVMSNFSLPRLGSLVVCLQSAAMQTFLCVTIAEKCLFVFNIFDSLTIFFENISHCLHYCLSVILIMPGKKAFSYLPFEKDSRLRHIYCSVNIGKLVLTG